MRKLFLAITSLWLTGCVDYTVTGYSVGTRQGCIEYTCERKFRAAATQVVKACPTLEECNRTCMDLNEQLRRERQ